MTGRRFPDATLDALAARLGDAEDAVAAEMRHLPPGPAYDALAERRAELRAARARVSQLRGPDVLLLDTREVVRADASELMGADTDIREVA